MPNSKKIAAAATKYPTSMNAMVVNVLKFGYLKKRPAFCHPAAAKINRIVAGREIFWVVKIASPNSAVAKNCTIMG